jgi:hypothetical protein
MLLLAHIQYLPPQQLFVHSIDVLPTIPSKQDIAAMCYIITPVLAFLDQAEVFPREFVFTGIKQSAKKDALTFEMILK